MVDFNPYDPRAAFLMGMGADMLKAGGWSPMPVSLGQALGQGVSGGRNAMMQAINMKRLRDAQQLEEGLQRAQIAKLEAEANAGPQPASSVAKIEADYRAGLIDEPTYAAAMEKATTSKPLVTVTQGYTNEMIKKMAAGDVEYMNELRDAASSAREAMPALNRAMRLVESGGFETGATAPVKLFLGRYARAFGLNPEEYGLGDVATGEEAEALFNRLVMDSLDKFKGALSEKELDYADRASASIGKTPEANRALVQLSINAADRTRRIYREARNWRRKYGSPDALNEEGIDFEESIDRMIEQEGDAIDLPPVESRSPEEEEEAPETAEAGLVPAERPEITAETNIADLTDDQILAIDLTKLTPKQRKDVDRRLTKMGY